MKIFYVKNLFLLTILSFLFINISIAKVHEYETTRLKSTAGAGVASILMDESAIYNPAPVAFFNVSSFYFQKINTQFYSESESPPILSKTDDGSYGLIVADSKGVLKGALSYQHQKESADLRKRLSACVAAPMGSFSSFGIIYRLTQDTVEKDSEKIKSGNIHQLVLGVTHAVNEGLSFGAIVEDPFKGKVEDTKAIIGGQILIQNIISLMVDMGANYRRDLSESFIFKSALQINFFQDLYLRGGYFQDKSLNEKGNGVGLGWISPKLVVDFALKNTQSLNSTILKAPLPKRRDVSLSLSYRF